MSYRFSPWRAVTVIVKDARRLRLEGRHTLAVQAQEAAAENRRRWLTSGTFHPQYLPKKGK